MNEPGTEYGVVTRALDGFSDRRWLLPREALRKAFSKLEDGVAASLCVVDVDGVGALNAMHGYLRGDDAIALTGGTLRGTLRVRDVVTHWTDDAFAVLFAGTDERSAVQLLEYALRRLRDQPLLPVPGSTDHPVLVTFSAGVHEVRGGAGFDHALHAAEQALTQAKLAGRNRVLGSSDSLLTKRRALVVEDDPVTAALVKGLLAAEGLEAVHVADGARALAGARGMGIALVVLDIMVPLINGWDILANLRRMPGYAHLPVLVLSGKREPEDIARGLDLGGDDYLVKPFSPVEFQARVRRLMHRDGVQGPALAVRADGREGRDGDGNYGSHA